jgi:hypothetical protein
MEDRMPQGSLLSPTLYNLYINDTPQAIGVHLALFVDDTCLYVTDRKEGYIVRKLQRGLDLMVAWCKRWNIKINEAKTRAIYFSHQRAPPQPLLTLNEWNIPFVNNVKYFGVIFDKRITWRLHIERIEAKAFRTFIRLNACLAWEFAAETHLLKLQCLQNRVLHKIGNFLRHTSVRDLHVPFQILYVYNYITKLCRLQAEVIQNHDNGNVHNIGKGEDRHRKYKRLKLGGCHLCDH